MVVRLLDCCINRLDQSLLIESYVNQSNKKYQSWLVLSLIVGEDDHDLEGGCVDGVDGHGAGQQRLDGSHRSRPFLRTSRTRAHASRATTSTSTSSILVIVIIIIVVIIGCLSEPLGIQYLVWWVGHT